MTCDVGWLRKTQKSGRHSGDRRVARSVRSALQPCPGSIKSSSFLLRFRDGTQWTDSVERNATLNSPPSGAYWSPPCHRFTFRQTCLSQQLRTPTCNGSRSLPPPLPHSRPGQTTLLSPSKKKLKSGPEESRARQSARRSEPLTPRTALGGWRRGRRARPILGRNPVPSPVKIAVRYTDSITLVLAMLFRNCTGR